MATPAKRLFRPPVRPAGRPDWATSRPTYRPRQPTATPLYPVVQHHIETFVAQAAESDPLGYSVPAWGRALWSDRVLSNTTLSYMTTGYDQGLWETSSRIKLIDQDSREGTLVLRNANRVGLGPTASLRFGVEAKAMTTDYS